MHIMKLIYTFSYSFSFSKGVDVLLVQFSFSFSRGVDLLLVLVLVEVLIYF